MNARALRPERQGRDRHRRRQRDRPADGAGARGGRRRPRPLRAQGRALRAGGGRALEQLGVRAIGLALRRRAIRSEVQRDRRPRRVDELGRIDVLVNNAGTVWGARPEDMPLEGWQKVVDVNLTGVFLCSQAAGRVMIEQGGGTIVNIASVAGLHGAAARGHEHDRRTTRRKGGVIAFTRDLAWKWARHGIRVNAIAPGLVPVGHVRASCSTPRASGCTQHIPLGRFGGPRRPEGRRRVPRLATRRRYVTGHTLVVDGGQSAWYADVPWAAELEERLGRTSSRCSLLAGGASKEAWAVDADGRRRCSSAARRRRHPRSDALARAGVPRARGRRRGRRAACRGRSPTWASSAAARRSRWSASRARRSAGASSRDPPPRPGRAAGGGAREDPRDPAGPARPSSAGRHPRALRRRARLGRRAAPGDRVRPLVAARAPAGAARRDVVTPRRLPDRQRRRRPSTGSSPSSTGSSRTSATRVEDVAWPLVRAWRFGADDRRLGGVGERRAVPRALRRAAPAATSSRGELYWWEVLGNVKWATGCLTQCRRHLTGLDRSVEYAVLGRMAAEMEYELLDLIERAHERPADRAELVEAVEEFLADEVLPTPRRPPAEVPHARGDERARDRAPRARDRTSPDSGEDELARARPPDPRRRCPRRRARDPEGARRRQAPHLQPAVPRALRVTRRRIYLMRHGQVAYFEDGRPLKPAFACR